MAFHNIVLWGVGGDNVGQHILQALIDDGTLNLTVMARQSSKSTYPAQLKIVRVSNDLEHDSLLQALHGQDALVSAVGPHGIADQVKLAEAAVEAGVKRFVPSEYSMDLSDPSLISLSPVFREKAKVTEAIDTMANKSSSFSWTSLATGMWIDWGLDKEFFDIYPSQQTSNYWDKGIHVASMTTLPYIGKAVVEVLKHGELFQNQRVFLQAFAASQNDIVTELEKQSGSKYQIQAIGGREQVRLAHEQLEKTLTSEAVTTTIRAGVWMPEYKSDFVASHKRPLLEEQARMPAVTLQEVVQNYLESIAWNEVGVV